MGSKLRSMFRELFSIDREERLKVLFLSLAFFFVIAGYTLAKDLKDSIFVSVVGKEYIPWAKMISMFVLVPAVLFYSYLVDKMRRYQLLSFYSGLFGVVGILFAYLIGHPTIGVANTDVSPYRLFGWLFYFFVEGYSPFVVNVFWAFANSINSPDSAKKSYGIMVSSSKLGGMISAGFAWMLFSSAATHTWISDVGMHQLVLFISSVLLFFVPFTIYWLMKKVPGKYLHGYEAVYQVEKQKKKEGKEKVGMFAGLYLLLKYPYVLGVFGMVYFYEVVATVLGYLRVSVAQANATGISDVSSFLFKTYFITHTIGFIISLLGTRALLNRLGERVCLLIIPLVSGALLLYFMLGMDANALVVAFVGLKALNYAFSYPVRESLYIPTVKEIKFKSKSWIDAFGTKFAKTSGSVFNRYAATFGASMMLPLHSFFFAGLVGFWFLTAFLLGKRFDKAISHGEVIGLELDSDVL
jgi:AAA family ATP:ADP antiporter